MRVQALVLRESLKVDDNDWHFTIPPQYMSLELRRTRMLKVTFSDAGIVLDTDKISSNRILHSDDPTKFILLGIKRTFRFLDHPPKVAVEYLTRMFKAGFFLNDVQYRFYHHSNSQLRERSCFLREANTDEELDERIYAMGDFGRIMNASKRAKRIGLLFSSAEVDFQLDSKFVADIPDIELGDEVFSDGCGLMSKQLAKMVAKKKGLVFRGTRYTPTVIQIRYLGYKGVLMIHPKMDAENRSRDKETENLRLAEFRKSMKKFKATSDYSFSVVGYSKPYSFGRLNNDIVVLLSSLGITDEKFLEKQAAYFEWIKSASTSVDAAIDFLTSTDKYPLAEKVFLNGLQPEHLRDIRKLQMDEVTRHHDKETGKFKTRMLIHKSRRLYGVCDPHQVLKEGQVHIRVTTGRKGPSTPIHGDVLVIRNPCLHPGDCLKLRAVAHDALNDLVDCIVFATVAKPGHKPAPSMSSGGDLDGDEFLVCWDEDLVPTKTMEPYDYPPNREKKNKAITRLDLATYFASYNSSGVARVSALHNKWAIASPEGALCAECQELNALHSQSVDGAVIKIPDPLKTPPEAPEGQRFIVDLLKEHQETFEAEFLEQRANVATLNDVEVEEPKTVLELFLKTKKNALSEYEIFDLALRLSRKYKFDLIPYLPEIDISALGAMEKQIMVSTLELSRIDFPHIWNSLFQSDILSSTDLNVHGLDSSFSLQKLYSSTIQSQATFFEYLRRATQSYTRKLLLIRTDDRFAIGIFMRGDIPWDEEPEVNDNVVVVSFLSQSSITMPTNRPCTKGYRLHCSFSKMELYNKNRSDTFIFMQRSPTGLQSEVVASIALQKISENVRRQIGRLNRQSLTKIELHVVSNHDRVAHQLFDMWYDHVPTEEHLRRFPRRATPYRLNDIRDVDWNPLFDHEDDLCEAEVERQRAEWKLRLKRLDLVQQVMYPYLEDINAPPGRTRRQHTEHTVGRVLVNATVDDLDFILEFSALYHADDELLLIFHHALYAEALPSADFIIKWITQCPLLVFVLFRAYPPTDDLLLHPDIAELGLIHEITYAIVRSANETRIAALVALEKIAASLASLRLQDYIDLLMEVALSVRWKDLVQEVLLVLNESRLNHLPQPLSSINVYAHKHALNVVFDRAEEAADECPCIEDGRPRSKQRTPPTQVKSLVFASAEGGWMESMFAVKAHIRVDTKHGIRLHSHVRLKATSKAENRFVSTPVLDGLVVVANKGEYRIKLMQPAPPELEAMDWLIYSAGSIATSQAMLDALKTLVVEKSACCRFYDIVTGDVPSDYNGSDGSDEEPSLGRQKGKQRAISSPAESTNDNAAIHDVQSQLVETLDAAERSYHQLQRVERDRDRDLGSDAGESSTSNSDGGKDPLDIVLPSDVSLNESQMQAIRSWDARLSLIWGPPAVDNVLERFIRVNGREQLLSNDQILRVATDQLKVNEDLHPFTLNDRVGGDVNENKRLLKQAEDRVKKATLVFSTCAGAGLGILRKFKFDIAIIDEASQITEPCALIPFVKGVKRGIMVGDHVQLRPLVRKLGMALEGDISLLERLYTADDQDVSGLTKTMLNVQYRSPQTLNAFPSREFYQNRLQTALSNEDKLQVLEGLEFPWPRQSDGQTIVPTVFIQCPDEEDLGGRSKSNEGQVRVILKVLDLLKPKAPDASPSENTPSITILSPYRGQIQKLKNKVSSSIPVSTVDSFQGRESDIIVFSTVRSNADGEIGFLEDHRRLNVMWTRARIALIIVGNQATLSQGSELWRRALEACKRVPDPQIFDPPPPPAEE